MDHEKMNIHKIYLPCGGVALQDNESTTCGYCCQQCLTIVGSLSQPKECADEGNKYLALEMLGDPGWDYNKPNGGRST